MNLLSFRKPMLGSSERITLFGQEEWRCICGNTAVEDGFYPCNMAGREVQPTAEEWHTDAYVCFRCGRIIDMHSLHIIGVRSQFENLRLSLENLVVDIRINLREVKTKLRKH